jgi:hypothetical protein
MKLKLFLKLSFVLTLLCFFGNVHAQSSTTGSQDETAIIQNLWGAEKKAIVAEYMNFNEKETKFFWPIYEEYADKRKKLGSDRIAILQDYVNNYENLTNEKAAELTKKIFKNNSQLDKLQMKYYNKMKLAITALRASQFMQLENYLQTMIQFEIQEELPFIGQLDQKKIN